MRHILLDHSLSSAALCRNSGSHRMQKAQTSSYRLGQHYFSTPVWWKTCCSWSNRTTDLWKFPGSQLLGFFPPPPAPLAAGVMKPGFILTCRQHIFIFGRPRVKFDQQAASISNSSSEEHFRPENRKRALNKSPSFCRGHKAKTTRSSRFQTSSSLLSPAQAVHICLLIGSYFSRAASSPEQ